VTGGSGRWYIAGRGDRNGYNVTDTTRKESPWVEVLTLAEKLLLLVGVSEPKGEFEISAAHMQGAVAIFWRAYRLYDGVLWHPAGGNVSAAKTAEDSEFALTAMGDASVGVKQPLDFGDWSVLYGQPIQSTPFVRPA